MAVNEGARVLAFGRFDKPCYRATVDRRITWDGYCCEKGHRTPLAAATHAARLAASRWKGEPKRDEKGYPVPE